jgi:hypothetical protein
LVLMAMTAAALPALAQSSLNPTVTVLASASGPVPPECETGMTTIAPRTDVAETAPAPNAVAPASDLGTKLRRVQAAAAGDEYEEFKAALAAARAAQASYPPGGERTAAEQALAVYADLERLWDYANRSKTGSFFDATADDGALLTMLNRYPGFGRATADATMEVGGQTVYPTRESRQFLAGVAGQRLARMGIRVPARATPPPVPPPAPQPILSQRKLRPIPTATAPAPRSASKTVSKTPRKPKPVVVKEEPAPAPPIVATPTEPPPIVTTTTAAPPIVTTTTATPPIVTATTATSCVAAPAPGAGQPEATTPDVATSTQPTATQSTAATAPTPEKPQAPGGRVNLLLALILIVVGLGVLIFLFRASD